ncbi:MAG: Crp/Fnr family transcriptional regulator [Eubacteriales bacterium]|nr:Crp/Fnr family transcriptional regulator [Eubacteriales bacterium]
MTLKGVISLPQICDRACQTCLDKLCTHKIPLFSALPFESLAEIATQIEHTEYPAGSVIIPLGTVSSSVTIISGGQAKACRYSADGREQILYIFSEGDFFGEQHLLSASETPYQVEALTDTRICQLSRQALNQLIIRHPELALQLIQDLTLRLGRLEQAIQTMGGRSIDARISTTLLDFAERYGRVRSDGIHVTLPLSREGLASYIGIARETISRKLGQLENDGIIESRGHRGLRIIRIDTLRTLAE